MPRFLLIDDEQLRDLETQIALMKARLSDMEHNVESFETLLKKRLKP